MFDELFSLDFFGGYYDQGKKCDFLYVLFGAKSYFEWQFVFRRIITVVFDIFTAMKDGEEEPLDSQTYKVDHITIHPEFR